MRWLAIGLLVVVACTRARTQDPPASQVAPASSSDGACAKDFAPPANAKLLCDEHVVGKGMEIHWRSWASTEARTTLDEPCGMKVETFDAKQGGYPTCATAPGPEHRTVIVVSEKHDRP